MEPSKNLLVDHRTSGRLSKEKRGLIQPRSVNLPALCPTKRGYIKSSKIGCNHKAKCYSYKEHAKKTNTTTGGRRDATTRHDMLGNWYHDHSRACTIKQGVGTFNTTNLMSFILCPCMGRFSKHYRSGEVSMKQEIACFKTRQRS